MDLYLDLYEVCVSGVIDLCTDLAVVRISGVWTCVLTWLW